MPTLKKNNNNIIFYLQPKEVLKVSAYIVEVMEIKFPSHLFWVFMSALSSLAGGINLKVSLGQTQLLCGSQPVSMARMREDD